MIADRAQRAGLGATVTLATLVRTSVMEWAATPLGEQDAVGTFLRYFDHLDAPFDQHRDPVHVTGSAMVTGPDGVLLHKHKRLRRWLPPGGHIDAGEAPWDAAVREVAEETGLAAHHPRRDPVIVRVDVHETGWGHIHLDLCYHLTAHGRPAPPPTESQAVRWFDWPEAVRAVAPDEVEMVAVAAALHSAPDRVLERA